MPESYRALADHGASNGYRICAKSTLLVSGLNTIDPNIFADYHSLEKLVIDIVEESLVLRAKAT